MKAHDHKRLAACSAGTLAALLLGACASTAPNYETQFGQAVRSTRQAQVLDPQAGQSPDLVLGLDGPAAREAMQRYRESFKAPPPVVNVINIGGSSAGR